MGGEQSVAEIGNRRRWVLFQSGLPSQTSGRQLINNNSNKYARAKTSGGHTTLPSDLRPGTGRLSEAYVEQGSIQTESYAQKFFQA